MFLFLFFYLPLCFCVGMFAAYRRNRNGVGWAALAFVISPLFGAIIVAILPPLNAVAATPCENARQGNDYHIVHRPETGEQATTKDAVQAVAVVIAVIIGVVFLAQLGTANPAPVPAPAPMAKTKMIPVAPLDNAYRSPAPVVSAPSHASVRTVTVPSVDPVQSDSFFESLRQTITGAGHECDHVIVHYVSDEGLRMATCKIGNANATFSMATRDGAALVQKVERRRPSGR